MTSKPIFSKFSYFDRLFGWIPDRDLPCGRLAQLDLRQVEFGDALEGRQGQRHGLSLRRGVRQTLASLALVGRGALNLRMSSI